MSLTCRRLAALATLHFNLSAGSAFAVLPTSHAGRTAAVATSFAASTYCFSLASSSSSSASQSSPTLTTNTARTIMSSSTTSDASTENTCNTLEVAQFPCLSDNYGYLIHDATTGETAAIDTPCSDTIRRELDKHGWKLTHILNTHHHYDHTGGNLDLKTDGVTIVGPTKEKDKVPGIDVTVGEGDKVKFGAGEATVMDVGGHTNGHVAYYFPDAQKVFAGDALFALGCGKMFEGTPKQFWKSLRSLRELPDETTVYCAHEYTASNAKFALSVEPGNPDLVARAKDVMDKRSRDEPTVPSKIGEEKKTNPFLRVDVSEEIRKNVGVTSSDTDDDAFAKVRSAKDTFRG